MSNIDKQALRERYSEKPAPKCHICGAVMSIQAAGAGGVTYGCSGRIDKDGEGYKFAEGRHFADAHYARSRVTDYSPSGDHEVLALLDEMAAAERRNTELTEALRQSVIGYKSCLRMGHDRIIDLGGDCDAPELMIAGNPDIQQAEKLLAAGIGNPTKITFNYGETLELARIALASLTAEPVASCIVEDGDMCIDGFGEYVGHSLPDGTHQLYAAPPAPVVPDAESVYARLSDHEKWSTSLENVNHVLNACRAAMLQAGNYPVIPDGWIKCSEQMPEPGTLVLVYTPQQPGDYPEGIRIGFDYIDPEGDDPTFWFEHGESYEHFCCVACDGMAGPAEKAPYTHWMPLPAAPQEAE